jgi:hypothetical protein
MWCIWKVRWFGLELLYDVQYRNLTRKPDSPECITHHLMEIFRENRLQTMGIGEQSVGTQFRLVVRIRSARFSTRFSVVRVSRRKQTICTYRVTFSYYKSECT